MIAPVRNGVIRVDHPEERHQVNWPGAWANVSIRALLAALVLVGASCSPKQLTVAPPVTMPSQFSASGNSPLSDRWWQSLEDSTLNMLVERALENNLTFRTAWDRLAQAEAIARREKASLVPTLNLSASAEGTEQRAENGGGSMDFPLGLASSYELDLWGRIRASRDAVAFDARATGEDLRTAAITLSAQVATTWYRLVQQYGQIELLEHQLRSNEEVLELVTLRFRQGQTKAEDVLQQRQIVESRRGEIARARSSATVLHHQLAILLGQIPTANVVEPSTHLVRLPPLPATGVPAELLQRRPDTRRAYYEVLAADRRVAAAVAERFPKIGITAQASTSGGEVRSLFDNWLASLAGSLTMPLIDGGRRRAEVERTRAVVSASLHAYGQVVLNALTEVEDALAQEQRQAEYIASLERQLELAAGVIERSKDNYMKGITDYIRVLNAQQTYQELERTYLDARATQIETRIALYRALSGGWAMTRPEESQLSIGQRTGL